MAGLAFAVLPGSAKAVPSFNGTAALTLEFTSINGDDIGFTFSDGDLHNRKGAPGDQATGGASAGVRTDGFPKLGTSAKVEGTANAGFAESAAFAVAGMGFETPSGAPTTLDLSYSGMILSLGTQDGGALFMDIVVGFMPSGGTNILSGLDFSTVPFDATELFAPGEILFSCRASTFDPPGCFGAPTSVEVEGGQDGHLVLVLGLQGTTRYESADAVPAPAAVGLFGLAVVGLGMASRRRSNSA